MTIEELDLAHNTACVAVQRAADAIDGADDSADLTELRTAFDDATEEARRTEGNLALARQMASARTQFAPAAPAVEARVEVVSDPPIYHEHNQHERSFFHDLYARDFGSDYSARERLDSHFRQARERASDREQRDIGTGAFTGLVVPQYLVDLYAPLARAGRPFANACCTSLPLPPDGMTLNISRLTTGTGTAVQATENSAVQETNADDTLLTINVRTIAGQQDLSRQLLDRATPGMDGLIFTDLLSAYHTTLNSSVINDDGTSGTHLGVLSTVGIQAVTYTDASPTVPEMYPKLADVIQRINSNRYLPPSHIVMHPRRWGWIVAALDTQNRPLVVPNAQGVYMAPGVQTDVGYGQVVGTMQGLPVVTDANLPITGGTGSNQDTILVVRKPDCLLWEDGDGTPRQARFEQTLGDQLTVKLVLFGYSAFAAGRYPAAHGTVTGTGLVTPTF